MTSEEKKSTYMALGVVTYIDHAITEYESQHDKKPSRIIVGRLEYEILRCNEDDDYMVNDVKLTCNHNIEHGIVTE